MKKFYLSVIIILAILTTLQTYGQPVSLQKAKDIANNHMNRPEKPVLKAASKKSPANHFTTASIVAEQQDTLYYILNDTLNQRFVIVAADYRSRPILGYSDQGIFDAEKAPEAMKQWMDDRKKEIRHLKSKPQQAESELLMQWESLATTGEYSQTSTYDIPPLIQTRWNQGCYYNALCPEDPAGQCGHAYTGCVATAMAQVMKYWNHPATGTGSNSYTHSTYGTLSADFGATTYLWDEMPVALYSENNAVATLMYHAGVSVNMYYGPYSSAGPTTTTGFINYFGYSANAQSLGRINYSEAEWNGILINELNLFRPVLYWGYSPNGGHAFIIDGIQNEDYFHINWGWGGNSDGYFYLGSIAFSEGNGAIIQLYPSNLSNGTKGFHISRENLAMGANAGTDTLIVTSISGWAATSDQSWLTITPSSGSAGLTKTLISVSDNDSENPRSGIITFTSDGYPSQIVMVTQDRKLEITAGNLKNLLSGKLTTTTNLTLTGTIDARDFKTIRDEMPLLEKLDLSEVKIVSYTGLEGTYGSYNFDYPADAIPIQAFIGHTGLVYLQLPASLKIIDQNAFLHCENIKTINIPASVTEIKYSAFSGSGALISVSPENNWFSSMEGLLYIKDQSKLIHCPASKTGTFHVPASVTTIGENAFSWCDKMAAIHIPPTVTSIEMNAFLAGTAKIMVDSGNTHFSSVNGVLFNKSVSNIISCPVSVSGHYQIPSTVTSISGFAFYRNLSLTSISLPETIGSIGHAAFFNCVNLKSLFVEPSVPVDLAYISSPFWGINKTNCTLYVPYGTVDDYKAAQRWNEFVNIVELPTVHFPDQPGLTCSNNQTYSINWTGHLGNLVRIELLKGEAMHHTLVGSAANNGTFEWTVPYSLEPGNNYKIRIVSLADTLFTSESRYEFTVAGPQTIQYPSDPDIIWNPGTIYEILWNDYSDPNVKLELLKGETVVRTITSGTANDGTMLWRAPSIQYGNDYRIRITSTVNPAMTDISDHFFAIEPEAMPMVTSPSDPGIVWNPGEIYEITWQDFTDPYVKLELLKGETVVRTITTGTANDGTMLWRAPSIDPGADYRIRITSTATPSMTDISDNFFAIQPAAMPNVIYPSEPGLVWNPGTIYEILWQDFTDPYVKIDLLKGSTVVRTVTTGTANDGTMLWRAPALESGTDYRIRITSTMNSAMTDISDNFFALQPAASPCISYPSEPGILWNPGTIYEITWQDFTDPYVKIELLKGANVVRTVTSATANDGTMLWRAPALESGADYRIRVTSTVNPAMTDISDNAFRISGPPQVTYPSTSGITWNTGTIYEITWQDFTDPYVKIELLKGETVVRTITSATANDGSMLWRIATTLEPGNDYRVRITSTATPTMTDVSDNPVTIVIPKSAVAFGDDPGGNGLSVYPNPFNNRATITYRLAEAGRTLLEIYDLTGRRVTTLQDDTREAGTYVMEWNATDANGQQVVPGMYLVRIQSGGFVQTVKLVFNY